jgi:uncharacterized protein DUF6939
MMSVRVDSRRKAQKTLEHAHPGAIFLDVTSRGPEPWVRFSPFYPHGTIPVPFTLGRLAASVEGIWQGLKVFERADIDVTRLDVRTMSGIKRTTRQLGPVLGHREGLAGARLLSYREARYKIYLPSYRYILEHCVKDPLDELRRLSAQRSVVLLDYETNESVEDLSKPLSHAGLIRCFIEDTWPVG